MPKFLLSATYSSGSWARMIRMSDDREKAVHDLLGSLGGSLESTHWEVSARCVYAMLDLPDSQSATAVVAVLTHTGGFKNVEAHEVLTQEQFSQVLELADSVAAVYQPPGQAVLDGDSSASRLGVHG